MSLLPDSVNIHTVFRIEELLKSFKPVSRSIGMKPIGEYSDALVLLEYQPQNLPRACDEKTYRPNSTSEEL